MRKIKKLKFKTNSIRLLSKKDIEKNLKILYPGIKDVFVMESPNKFHVTISVTLPWWKWLIPFAVSYVFRKKIENIILKHGCAGVLYVVKVG